MIIVRLTGGMGNQMFQYAIGRHLAIKHNTVLKLDLNFFKTYEWHEYSLAPLCIDERIATNFEIKRLKGGFSNKYINRLYDFFMKMFLKNYYLENGLEFHPEVLNLPNNIYLEGYFQSEKYFVAIKEQIKKDFAVKIKPSQTNVFIIDKINSLNSVSLHIRRGVYATVPEVNKAHGLSPLDYYYQAITYIQNHVINPHIFVFSDDINWAKENLKLENDHVFVDQNTDKTDYEDIRMMSLCKHNILANSTFSWWAAWLNPNPDKIVIAPEKWYNDTTRNTQDLIPEGWVRL